MAKNNCCKICGRLDYEEDGEYLVCRVCGEKRRKRRIPLSDALLSLLFFFCGLGSLELAFNLVFYPKTFGFFSFFLSLFDRYSNIVGTYNIIDLFIDKFNKDGTLTGITTFFIILGIAFLILSIFFVKRIYDSSKRIIV